MSKEISGLYEFGRYRLDIENRVLFRNGQAVALPPKAVERLAVLVESNGQVVTKELLMARLWPDSFVEDSNLTQHIFLLRKVFSEDGDRRKYIETIPRRGYRREYHVMYLKVHPNLDPLRTDPGFQDLLRRTGLAK
jgi:DNA-binding winged helix-turn-helix (wHTH) protein